jgi:prefoldin alpha subunit
MTKEDDQRKLQGLMMQIRSYQSTLQEISRQNALTERAIADLENTIEALQDLPKSKKNEALVPLGAGVFVKANLLDKKNVVVAVGSGVNVTKSAKDTATYLKERKSRIEVDDKKLRDQAEKISKELEAANKSAEELYAKVQKG